MATYASPAASASPEKSTIVRTITSPSTWATRLSFRVLSTLSPGVAARVAERRFLTPPRHSEPAHERDALARGTAVTVRDGAGHRIRAWRFGDGRATVLLVHGWGGRGGQLAAWLEPLEDAGFSVVTFDAPAHGGSSGRHASLPVFSAVIGDLARRFDVRAVVAHSMGAAALALALGNGLDLDAAVLIAPPRSPAAFLDGFAAALGLSPEVVDAIALRLARRYGVAIEQLDVPAGVARVSSPVLIVHDKDDREVPWTDGAAIAAACPGAHLVTTNGLGHRRVLREPAIVRRGVEFLRACALASLVSVPAAAGARHA